MLVLTLGSSGPGHYREKEWEVVFPWRRYTSAEALYAAFVDGDILPSDFMRCVEHNDRSGPAGKRLEAVVHVAHVEMVELK